MVTDAVLATICAIEGFKLSPGTRLAKFISDIPSPSNCFYFKEQRITDSAAQREQFNANKDTFIDKLVENLRSRFLNSGSLSALAIFEPQKLPAETDLATYGDAELEILCEHYGTAKETENGR